MTEKELKRMSKDELELLCRDKGVELDKRLKKSKLLSKAIELFVATKSAVKKVTKKSSAAPLTFRERYGLPPKK
tara:strand:+ start:8469 stop:8690 length:222 start_codon:yes stop_codon:yes gene_type:complete